MSAINESPASPTPGIPPDERRLLEQAIHWRTCIENGWATRHDTEYLAWLSDPLNRQAMNNVQTAWDALEDHAQTPGITKLRHSALADVRRHRDRVAVWPMRMIAAAVTLVIGIGLAAYMVIPRPETYATPIGERHIVTLSDRSTLSLDADTKVLVHYSGKARKLILQRGRARFDVAHDRLRPFTVVVGEETVTAVGTNFSVERLENKTVVMLLQGKVVVTAAESTSHPPAGRLPRAVSLRSGEKLVVSHTGLAHVETFEPDEATAWESGRLQFFDEPLSEAVVHVNRYTATPIEVDRSAADIKVSGVFAVGDVTAFVEGVTGYFPVEAASIGDRTVLRGKSNDADNCAPMGDVSFICGESAAEDLLAVPGSPWVVASSFSGSGGLRVIDARDKSIVTVYPSTSATDKFDKKTYGACPGAPDGEDSGKFQTHGIAVAQGKDGRYPVLAVHHGARESIEVFSLDVRGNAPVASWIGCVVAPDVVSLNSVVALPEGGFIATNFRNRVPGAEAAPDARLRSGANSGELWEWHPGGEWVKVPGSESSGPNGLEISKDGRTLYIGAWGSQSLVRISRGSARVKRDEAPLGFRVDNLHWTADGMLIAAGQTESPSPGSRVVEIDPHSLQVTRIIDRPNTGDFGFGTAALRVGKQIWVGSFRSNRVAVFPAAAPVSGAQ